MIRTIKSLSTLISALLAYKLLTLVILKTYKSQVITLPNIWMLSSEEFYCSITLIFIVTLVLIAFFNKLSIKIIFSDLEDNGECCDPSFVVFNDSALYSRRKLKEFLRS